MYRKNIISFILLISLSIFLIFQSKEMTLISDSVPGPGAFPLLLGFLLFVTSFILLYKTISDKIKNNNTKLNIKNVLLVGVIFVISLVYYHLFSKVNFILLTIIYFFTFIHILERQINNINKKNILHQIVLSILLTTLIYSIFNFILGVPLS